MTKDKIALIIGGRRGIGLALTRALEQRSDFARVFTTSRNPSPTRERPAQAITPGKLTSLPMDLRNDESVAAAAKAVSKQTDRIDLLINCAGVLHDDDIQPEKRLNDIDAAAVERVFRVNAIGTLVLAREFSRLLTMGQRSCFAALSARVGSIGDNRRGGWYSYRASKAALNMIVRNLAIEWARAPNPVICVALHPGTVATDLSRPFRRNDGPGVFTADEAAANLLRTIDSLGPDDTGRFLAYDGSAIEW